jgi:DNA-binding transcriptional LysR family regulator
MCASAYVARDLRYFLAPWGIHPDVAIVTGRRLSGRMSKLNRLAWDDLRLVLEVARQGSIFRAAGVLRVDHSTVTRRLAHVEYLLEQRLFDRSNRGLRSRPETEHLLEHIRKMEAHAMALGEELGRITEPQVRAIRIATMEGLASGYLARRVDAITQGDSSLRIELFSNPHIVDLLRKDTDIFLSFFDPGIPGLVSKQIGEVAIYLYGSELYAQLHGLPKSIDELSAHRYVGYIDEMVSIESVKWLHEVLPDPTVSFCSNSVFAQRSAALCGIGLVVLPVFVGEESQGMFRVLPDQIRTIRPIWMSIGRDQLLLKAIKSCAEGLTRVLQADAHFLQGDVAALGTAAS